MTTATAEVQLSKLPIGQLRPSKTNPRKRFDEAQLNELAASIKKQGIVSPILCRLVGSGYEIIAGERRFRAAALAGLKEVPVIVREIGDRDALEIQVIENLQRSDLHPLEEADGYQQLLKLKGYDAAKIAEQVGRSVKYVYDRIKLLNLIEPLRKVFFDGEITAGHAILLARLKPADQKRAMAFEDSWGSAPSGLWRSDRSLFTPDQEESELKTVRSVRELAAWIDEHVKFDAAKDADPMLFPETAVNLKTAAEKAEQIVPITHEHYIAEDARDGQKVVSPRSWVRADGKHKSKTCEHSLTGVIVVGAGRGQAFKVCIAKEKCKTHWGQWQRERVARQKLAERTPQPNGPGAAEKARLEEAERVKKEMERFNTALPAMFEALAGAVKKAPIVADGLLMKALVSRLDEQLEPEQLKLIDKLIPMGAGAESLFRHAAFLAIIGEMESYMDVSDELPKVMKRFGLNAKKILDEAAPLEEKSDTKKKPAKK